MPETMIVTIDAYHAQLAGRGLLAVTGEDRVAFLQGLISNDVERVDAGRAIYAAFLTPQGKFLFDFILAAHGEALLIDCERVRRADFLKRLTLYKLRSRVEITDVTQDWSTHAVYGRDAQAAFGLACAPGLVTPHAGGLAISDPRLVELGVRFLLPFGAMPQVADLQPGSMKAYNALRIGLGVPNGEWDMEVNKTTLLEAGFDELNGIDWDKGCYMGQELTARTRYRGLVKRRLVPVEIDSRENDPAPEPGTRIMRGEREAGEIRSYSGRMALALVRLAALEGLTEEDGLTLDGGVRVTLRKPDWAKF